jgi:hypothetical protein
MIECDSVWVLGTGGIQANGLPLESVEYDDDLNAGSAGMIYIKTTNYGDENDIAEVAGIAAIGGSG